MRQSIKLEAREVLALYEITASLLQTPAIIDVNKGANRCLQDVANACLLSDMCVYLLGKHNRLRHVNKCKKIAVQLHYSWLFAFAQVAATVNIGDYYSLVFQSILLKLNLFL